MRGVIRDDLIVAISSENGVPIPHSRIEYLRYDPVAKAVIDIRQLPQPYTFYIDPNGVKHIVQIEPDWQPLDCNWDDELVFENGKWRIKTKEEKFQEYKQTQIAKLNRKAKDYIAQILKELDWGVSYEEALSELQNSALDAETRILYFLKPQIADITLTQIREKVALYPRGDRKIPPPICGSGGSSEPHLLDGRGLETRRGIRRNYPKSGKYRRDRPNNGKPHLPTPAGR